MASYVVRRVLVAVPVLLGLTVVLFVFIHLLPGDPAAIILGERATEALKAAIRHDLGLDRPLYDQYVLYLGQLLQGNFGSSAVDGRPVLGEFLARFPATIELAAAALLVAVGVGVPLGRFAASHAQGKGDSVATVVSLLGISIPVFVVGLSLQYFIGVQLHVLPVSGQLDPRIDVPDVTRMLLIDTLLAGRPDYFVDALRHLVLPAIALGTIPMASVARITRAAVLDVMHEDHVRTARAKGLTERRISSRYIMRNAWLPVVTVIGLQAGGLLGGAVLTETVFSWNGIGRWTVQAITNRDYLVIQGSILIIATVFLIVNLLVDIMYVALNPRIRFG
jgi:peptide/nickel transport system permease protein